MPTVAASYNPPVSGGTVGDVGGGPLSDESTDYPAVSTPAFSDPTTYSALGAGSTPGVTIEADEPTLIHELFGAERGGYFWYPSGDAFGYSGHVMAWMNMTGDNVEGLTESTAVFRSSNFGQPGTWSRDTEYDVFLRNNGPCAPRIFDPETGRIVEFQQAWKPDPLGQHRDFKNHYTWYANGGAKRAQYLWGSTIRGLPLDCQSYTPTVFPTREPRHFWDFCANENQIIVLNDGSWGMVVGCLFVGHTYQSGCFCVSTDKGRTWTFRSLVGGAYQIGVTENALLKGPTGKLICCWRDYGPFKAGDSTPDRMSISTDALGTSWGTDFEPSEANTGAPGDVAPSGVTLDNGIHVIAAGRYGADGLNVSVCTDGSETTGTEWRFWSLQGQHNAYSNDNSTSIADGDPDPGLIRKYWLGSQHSTGYIKAVKIGPNEVLFFYDFTPQYREEIGADFPNIPNQLYCMRARFSITP
jgi:hypothetical protein